MCSAAELVDLVSNSADPSDEHGRRLGKYVERAIECLGTMDGKPIVSRSTIFAWLKQRQQNTLPIPGRKKRESNRKNANKWGVDMDFLRIDLRLKMHACYEEGVFPTVGLLMDHIFDLYPDIPEISSKTFRKWLKTWGFTYTKADNMSFYLEREDVREDRAKFIRDFKRCVAQGMEVVFGDETWVNQHHTRDRCWQYEVYDKAGNVSGFKGSMKMKSGAGKRLILNHFITSSGFVPNARDLFEGKTDSGDYHSEMNGEHYHDYIKTKLGPNLPDTCVVVIDRASYHMCHAADTKFPKRKSTIPEIKAWLLKEGFTCLDIDGKLKEELLDLVNSTNPVVEYEVDRILMNIPHSSGSGVKNIKVLRLPTKHCMFNPIELVWAWTKNEVGKRNTGSNKLQDVLRLTGEALDNVPSDLFGKCFAHAMKEIDRFDLGERFLRTQEEVGRVVLRVGGDDDDFESDDESECENERQEVNVRQSRVGYNQEDDIIAYHNAVTATEMMTPKRVFRGCSCKKMGCTTKHCSCRSQNKGCLPTCMCEECRNPFTPPTTITGSTAVEPEQLSPPRGQLTPPPEQLTPPPDYLTLRAPPARSDVPERFLPYNPDSTTPIVAVPRAQRTPSQQRRSRRTSGGCHCRSSNCRTGVCICHKNGRVCGPECTCLNCTNTSDRRKQRPLQPSPSLPPPPPRQQSSASSVFDFV